MEGIFDDILNDKTDITPKYTCNNFLDNILIEQIKYEAKMEAKMEFCSVYMNNELYYQNHVKCLTEQLLLEREKNKKLSESFIIFSTFLKEYKEKYEFLVRKCIKKRILPKSFLEKLLK
jgi:hypothetical protein